MVAEHKGCSTFDTTIIRSVAPLWRSGSSYFVKDRVMLSTSSNPSLWIIFIIYPARLVETSEAINPRSVALGATP